MQHDFVSDRKPLRISMLFPIISPTTTGISTNSLIPDKECDLLSIPES